jgi:hypothetical protein
VARTCTICSHPKLVNIDRQLLRGDMLNGIAHRFHVSPDALGRHRRHMRTAMLKAQAASEKRDLVYGQTLIDEVKAIKADAERLQLEAEDRLDPLARTPRILYPARRDIRPVLQVATNSGTCA